MPEHIYNINISTVLNKSEYKKLVVSYSLKRLHINRKNDEKAIQEKWGFKKIGIN